MDDSRALEAVKAVFHIWEAIFDGRSLDLHDNGWRASGLKAPVCDPDSWQLIGGHFTRGDHWLPPAIIRRTLQGWLPPVSDPHIPSNEGALTRDDIRLALADLGLDLSTATIAAWHALDCAKETAGEKSAKIAGRKHDQKKKLYTDIALRFTMKPIEQQQFSAPFRPPRWRPDHPRWVSETARLIDALQATPVTARSPRGQFNTAIASRGKDYVEELGRLSNSSRLSDLVRAGGHIAVQQRFIAYVHLLHGPSWRGETLCSPEKSGSGIHAQVRFRADKLFDEWAIDFGDNPRRRDVETIGNVVVKRAVSQSDIDHDREQEKVLLDLAVHDVLAGRGRPFTELFIDGCIEAMNRSLHPNRQFAAQERLQRFGSFALLESDSLRDRRSALAMMHEHIRETVDEDFRAEYLETNGERSRNHSPATTSKEKQPDA